MQHYQNLFKKALKLNYLFPIMINETGNIVYMSHNKTINVVTFRDISPNRKKNI